MKRLLALGSWLLEAIRIRRAAPIAWVAHPAVVCRMGERSEQEASREVLVTSACSRFFLSFLSLARPTRQTTAGWATLRMRRLLSTDFCLLTSAFRLLLSSVFLLPLTARAESELPFEHGLEKVVTELHIAQTGIRALSIAAHPDDEDGGTLSYLRRTLGVETHLCLTTRGEGGQNESGPELDAELAVLRSKESEAACAILGAKLWFLNLPDFGFSKSPDATLKIWGHDEALRRMVRIIRIVRPHIIFTNHDPGRPDDHGHHVATARIALEAFDAAADAEKFKEDMAQDGTKPWATSKFYVRHFAPPGATLTFDISQRDALTGLSAPEIAALALSKHVSQGMQRSYKAGEKEIRYFALTRTRVKKKESENEGSFYDGVENPEYDYDVVPLLRKRGTEDKDGIDWITTRCKEVPVYQYYASAEDSDKPAHLANAWIEIKGIKIETRCDDALLTPGDECKIVCRIANTGLKPVWIADWSFISEPGWNVTKGKLDRELAPRESVEFETTISATEKAYPTYPKSEYVFDRTEARSPVQFCVNFAPTSKDEKFVSLTAPVAIDLTKPVLSSIRPNPVLLFDDPATSEHTTLVFPYRLAVTNYQRLKEPRTLYARIRPVTDVPVDKPAAFKFDAAGETISADFSSSAPVDTLNEGDVLVALEVFSEKINFGGPVARLRRVPLKLPSALHIALVKSYDDAVFNALKTLEDARFGMTVTLLTPDDLRSLDLSRFHTIVLDIRSTQYRPELRAVKKRLKSYMEDGGNVVCLYQKDFDWNPPDAEHPVRGAGFFRGQGGGGEIAPYPLTLSFKRVTDPKAPVRILKPDHPLLLEPCNISKKDFDGWEQERGVYFPVKWGDEYTALLSSNDEGGPPLDGGLLVADVGEGSFIYTSYVLHRQLRAGVPGAYRLFANMLSYPLVKKKYKR